VIDEQTKHAVGLTPPAGCSFLDWGPRPGGGLLGGSWVVATCNSSSDEPRLYSIPNASWARFTPDTAQMCALNPDCGTVYPPSQCSAEYIAIGNQWIEFWFACGYHTGTVTDSLQQIRSGQVIVTPAGAAGGLRGAEPKFWT
jgi:hypothetical protein